MPPSGLPGPRRLHRAVLSDGRPVSLEAERGLPGFARHCRRRATGLVTIAESRPFRGAGQPALATSRASAPGGPRGMGRSEAGAVWPVHAGPTRIAGQRRRSRCGQGRVSLTAGHRLRGGTRRIGTDTRPASLRWGRDRRVGTPRTWRSDTVGITDEPASSAQRCLTPANPQTAAAGRSGARIRFRPARRSGRRPPPGGHGSGPGSGRAEPGSGRPPPACGSPP